MLPKTISICNLVYQIVEGSQGDTGKNAWILIDTDRLRFVIERNRPEQKKTHLLLNCISTELLEYCGASFSNRDWAAFSDVFYSFLKNNCLDWVREPEFLPNSVILGPTTWKVETCNLEGTVRGYCIYDLFKMQLSPKLIAPAYVAWALIHEITHAMAWMASVSWFNEEKRIRPLSQYIYNFILNNSLDWLKEGQNEV